jgi:pimeloyl-ACP methyl ester carboxylesterase
MLHREETGSGPPLVTVHGAWADGRHWTRLARELAGTFRVTTYDRRGHGRSGGEHTTIGDDVGDLAGLLAQLGEPAHVVGGSLGGAIALRAAARDRSAFLTLAVHEPALAPPGSAAPRPPAELPSPREFAEQSLGAGAWDTLTGDERAAFEDNGAAWRVEIAEASAFDTGTLAAFERPLLVTIGGDSPPFWRQVAETIPGARIATIPGAGHLPHLTHARAYAELLRDFASAARPN